MKATLTSDSNPIGRTQHEIREVPHPFPLVKRSMISV